MATLFPALPTCLEHLTISLLFRWGNSGIDWLSLIEEEWFEIHDSLEDLTQLQEVTVALQDEKDQSMTFFEKMNDILLVRFPTLHQRGQLRIVFPGQ